MRTIDVRITAGGTQMEDTEVLDLVTPQTAEIPVVRPEFTDLLTQSRDKTRIPRPTTAPQHGGTPPQVGSVPFPLLPAPRLVLDPQDDLLVAPRSTRSRLTKDQLADALWKTALGLVIVLLGLMIWWSDTGKAIREELSIPGMSLPMEAPTQSADRPQSTATQSAAPAPRVKRSQTQSIAGRVALPTQSAAPEKALSPTPTQSADAGKGSDPVLPVTPTQSDEPSTPESTPQGDAPTQSVDVPEGPEPGVTQSGAPPAPAPTATDGLGG